MRRCHFQLCLKIGKTHRGNPENGAMKKIKNYAAICLFCLILSGCGADSGSGSVKGDAPVSSVPRESTEAREVSSRSRQGGKIDISVGDKVFSATLFHNPAAEEFSTLLPLEMDMEELNGNEKYFYMDTPLPRDASCPDSVQEGDIMLYGDSCIVIFYEGRPTTYSYTQLGRIEDPRGLAEVLGAGNVTVKIEAE